MLKKFFNVGRLTGVFLFCSFLGLFLVFCCFYSKPEDEWIARCGSRKISSGEYVFIINQKLMEANSKLFGSGQLGSDQKKLDFKKLEQGRIGPDSKKTFDWISDEAKDEIGKFLLVRKYFDEKGYGNSVEFKSMVERNLPDDEDWDEVTSNLQGRIGIFDTGVAKKTLFKVVIDDILKSDYVLSEVFGNGKPGDFSSEVPDFVKNNFLKYKIVSVMKDDSYQGYKEQKGSDDASTDDESKLENGESKLEKLEGVKTPQELIAKYMDELKEGKKTLDEIGSSYNENFGGSGSGQKEVPTTVTYANESELIRDNVPVALKKMVGEVEPNGAATLKEDTTSWHIIQRFDLSDEDVEPQKYLAYNIMRGEKVKEFYDKLKAETNEPIEFNEKLLKKYSVARQVKKFIDKNPVIDDGSQKRN